MVSPGRAENHATALKQPGDQRPAAGGVDPRLTGLFGDQRRDGERKGNREADIAEVQHGRVNGHGWILQGGAEAVAIGHRHDQLVGGQHAEGVGNEIIEDQEEDLHRAEDADHPWHHVVVAAPVGGGNHHPLRGEDPTPQQQRAFLP